MDVTYPASELLITVAPKRVSKIDTRNEARLLTSIVPFITHSNPPDTITMAPVIAKFTVREKFSCPHNVSELADRRLRVAFRTFTTVQISPEDTAEGDN